MTHALEIYNGTISIGGRQITNLRFADDIDGITGEDDELTKLVHNLNTAATKFGMKISAGKTKIMTNNGTLQRDTPIEGHKLETVDHFNYLGAIICDEGSRREVLSRAAQTMAALARLKIIWKEKNIRIKHKIRLMRAGHNNIPLCMSDLDTHSRTTEDTSESSLLESFQAYPSRYANAMMMCTDKIRAAYPIRFNRLG